MNTFNITRYDFKIHDSIDEFEEMLHHIEFTHSTGQLALAGLTPDDIDAAVGKAMKICRLNGIDPSEHFNSLYIFDEKNGDTYCEWRMTDQGFALAIINAAHTNTAIAHWQWEFVNAIKMALAK
jgi:hypothetical protein